MIEGNEMKSMLIFAIALVLVNLMVGCAGMAKGAGDDICGRSR